MPVLAPDYPAHRPAEAVSRLLAWFARLPSPGDRGLVLVGSSIGGFYGQYLACRLPVARLYLVNPALAPWDLLPPYLGQAVDHTQASQSGPARGRRVRSTYRLPTPTPAARVQGDLRRRGSEP